MPIISIKDNENNRWKRKAKKKKRKKKEPGEHTLQQKGER